MEAVLLEKATVDGQYVGGAFPSNDAGSGFRIWGLRVIETVALENGGSRYLVVMDSQRAAYLWLREDITISLGLADDDFVRNKRRVLAEERAAFGVVAPEAIATLETEAGMS